MYDSEAEIAQAKRDCVALAEEVQRLRGEVQRERTGRKKAMAAKKIASYAHFYRDRGYHFQLNHDVADYDLTELYY